ncbi:MAG: 16S rRNA (guanine(527)-N(7))-methyltransferase RsmG [Pelagibacteraceae bacterium TMED65]|nr:16S rRNA (guanine(527)-N(7))-methyltransferase RsmG [Rickettsiales bacterium]OUU51554.1 MAG: 16S rRNA (guanine(527)-N(7))-methyltransferase RsmG [Pelagibacteraceae bacterium TMED65]
MYQLENKEDFKKYFDVSRETITILENYHLMIKEFGYKNNIISSSSKRNIWCRHFADSAKLFSIIESTTVTRTNKPTKICDVGTGAGFPGIVLAILNIEKNKRFNFTLVESNKKKFNFLESVIAKLKLDISITDERAENLNQKFDIITARALAPLKIILEYTKNIMEPQTILVLPKGKSWEIELEQIKKKWNYDLNVVKNNNILDKTGGVTLILKRLILK